MQYYVSGTGSVAILRIKTQLRRIHLGSTRQKIRLTAALTIGPK